MEPGPALSITSKRLTKRAEKHLRRFVASLAELAGQDAPATIHDVRVSTRRLQQIFAVIFPKPRTQKQRELIRILRWVRRRLGVCRSLDVNLDLITEAINGAPDPAARNAWRQLRSHLQKERKREIKRATRKLSRYRRQEFVALSHKCLERISPKLASRDIYAALQQSLEQAGQRWHETFVSAKQNRDSERLHSLRIAGKRLRYRAELLAQFGDSRAKVWVKELKGLQQSLGHWHDRHVLFQSVAEFVGRPNYLLNEPEMARSLVNEMEKEHKQETGVVESIISSARKLSETVESMQPSNSSATDIRQVAIFSHPRFARRRS